MSSIGSIPFTAYDFFGYLAEGFLMLIALDAAFVADPSVFAANATTSLLLIAASYVIGQLIGQLAGGLMETLLFDKTQVGFPSVNLFVTRTDASWPMRLVFGAYQRPLPTLTRRRVLNQPNLPRPFELPGLSAATEPDRTDRTKRKQAWRELAGEGEALFHHCYGVLNARGADSGRLANLLNVYAFCRNMSLTLALAAIAMTAGMLRGSAHTGHSIAPGWWAAGAALTATGLFLRYLKIYRMFHQEIFITYAELPADPGGGVTPATGPAT